MTTQQDDSGLALEFQRLVEIMDRLRGPGGCPWDAQQTHQSLVRYLIEEAYEVVEAIEAPGGTDRALLKEELGDVLLQVVFHAKVASEQPATAGGFGMLEVVRALNEKLVRRHPHVFSDAQAPDADSVSARWEELKRAEKPERTGPFDGVPPHLPALALAEKTLSKGAKASLPGPEPAQLPQEVLASEQELGDYLLALVAAARQAGLDPERALRQAVRTYQQQVNPDY